MRTANAGWRGSLRPGEERTNGADCACECMGYQALDDKDPSRENPMQVLNDLIEVVNPHRREQPQTLNASSYRHLWIRLWINGGTCE